MHSVCIALEPAKQQFEELVNYFVQSNSEIQPLIDKQQALDEYPILHTYLINERNQYLNVGCQIRVFDFWNRIFSMRRAQLKNVCTIMEAMLVCQVNICCCERAFGLRKLILNPRRSAMISANTSKIMRIKINAPECNEFEKCKSFYQRCVSMYKTHHQQNENQ